MSKNKPTAEVTAEATTEVVETQATTNKAIDPATPEIVAGKTTEPMRPPSLGDIVRVVCAEGHTLRTPDQSTFFSETEPTTVTVDTRIYRLIADGDLIVVE